MVIGKKVSIIVPVYNVEKYLDRCIESLAEQTYKNTEIILVNDGSTDGSSDILNKWRKKDSRIIVVNKENGGLSDARNAGIRIAGGDYFCFVDSDDYINRCMIEHLMNLCSAYRVPMAGCGYTVFSGERINQPCFDEAKANIEKIDFKSYLQKYMQNETVKMITAWGKIYAKELFDDIEYPANRIHEDEFTTYKLMFRAKEAVFSNAPYYYYFSRADSIMATRSVKSNYDTLSALSERDVFLRQADCGGNITADWGKWLIDHSFYHCLECVAAKYHSAEAIKMYRQIYKQYYRLIPFSFKKTMFVWFYRTTGRVFKIKRKLSALRRDNG